MHRKPNVILMNCDDLGFGDLGCYGSAVNDTPTIDRIAAEGMRLTSCYSASPVCSPSRSAMMTGCYPPRVSINQVLFPGDPLGLSPEEYTIPRLFKDAGYATMHIGKWHCGDQPEFLPQRFGFDSYFGLPYSNDMGIQVSSTPGVPVKDRPPLPLLDGDDVIEEQPDQRALTERYVEHAVRFIRANSDRPFFLYFAHMHVHLPLYAAERFVNESRNGDFGACVMAVDWSCAVLMHELRKLGLEEDTLFIFTSDNGSRGDRGASNAPLHGAKASTWEGGQRVPMIAHWKGHIKPGQVCGHTVSNIDLLPSFAELIGQPLPNGRQIDGLNILPTWFEAKPVRDTFLYFRQMRDNKASLEAVRKGAWKLFVSRTGESVSELYNLETDIGESENVYDKNPSVVEELKEIYKSGSQQLGDAFSGTLGTEVRPCAHVENPVCLTEYDENHPYIIAMYDKGDRG